MLQPPVISELDKQDLVALLLLAHGVKHWVIDCPTFIPVGCEGLLCHIFISWAGMMVGISGQSGTTMFTSVHHDTSPPLPPPPLCNCSAKNSAWLHRSEASAKHFSITQWTAITFNVLFNYNPSPGLFFFLRFSPFFQLMLPVTCAHAKTILKPKFNLSCGAVARSLMIGHRSPTDIRVLNNV